MSCCRKGSVGSLASHLFGLEAFAEHLVYIGSGQLCKRDVNAHALSEAWSSNTTRNSSAMSAGSCRWCHASFGPLASTAPHRACRYSEEVTTEPYTDIPRSFITSTSAGAADISRIMSVTASTHVYRYL